MYLKYHSSWHTDLAVPAHAPCLLPPPSSAEFFCCCIAVHCVKKCQALELGKGQGLAQRRHL